MSYSTEPVRAFPRRIADALLDVFFPRECLILGICTEDSPYRFISKEGYSALRFLDENTCPSCGAPRAGVVSAHGQCVFCRDRKFHFARSRSLVALDHFSSRLIHAVKYRAFHAAEADMAKMIVETDFFANYLAGATLVPVPLFRTRENKRGYNQSRILAKEIVRRLPGTRVEVLLRRSRDTGTQTRLSANSRKVNVRGAFYVPEKLKTQISPKTRYVIIDDVFTTGSTLSECARALKRAGAKIVDAATFAHG